MGAIDTTKRHYQHLLEQEANENHPADEMVGQMADVVDLDRTAREMSVELSASEGARRSAERWTEYEDVRFNQRALREERFFDVGYEMGRLAGIAESRAAGGLLEAETLGRQVHEVVVRSHLSPTRAAVVLLDAARALVLTDRGSSQSKGR